MNGQSKEEYIAGYRGQVEFLNQRIPDLIRRLLAEDGSDPYIILMSDHGPRLLYGERNKTKEELQLTCANLMALRVPSGVRVPESALSCPLNLMRFVTAQMTGQDFVSLPVRVYLSYGDAPYSFEEVTAKVRGEGSSEP